nr:DUF6884 domain-containing protein [Candidatus Laterigemmans baculatus]
MNREYAESFADPGDQWVILSAKYGFLPPDFLIPGPYEVTFAQRSSGPVGMETLRQQVQQQHLDQFRTIIGLGGKEYRAAIEAAFSDTAADLQFPFAGLPIGKAMQATKSGTRNRQG